MVVVELVRMNKILQVALTIIIQINVTITDE